MIHQILPGRCRRTVPAYTPPTPGCTQPTPAHKALCPPWCRQTPLRCRPSVGTRNPPTPPTPHRKLRRRGGARNSEEDVVERTFGQIPIDGSRQEVGVLAAHPYTPMGGGGP